MDPAPLLFCSHVVEWGGAERVLADLLTGLDRRAFALHLAAPGGGPLPDFARAHGVAVHDVPLPTGGRLRKTLGLPRAASALRQLAAGLRCDLLYANTMIAGYAGVLAQHAGLRCLWHVHVVTRSRVARAAAARAAAVVTPSRAGAAALAPAPVEVVQNGVPPAFFAAATAGLRQALGLPGDARLIGICGRIDPHKGHAELLQAVARLAGPTPCHVVIAGAEAFATTQARVRGFTDALQRLSQDLGIGARVHFLGHRDDLPAVLADLDVVAVPSTAPESAPRAVVEGQAAGRAVLASAIGGIGEAIEHGATGILCPPGDVDALAAALASLVGDDALRARLGAAGREHARRQCGMDVFLARIAAVCTAARSASRRAANAADQVDRATPPRADRPDSG